MRTLPPARRPSQAFVDVVLTRGDSSVRQPSTRVRRAAHMTSHRLPHGSSQVESRECSAQRFAALLHVVAW